jgi:hypothetical protein
MSVTASPNLTEQNDFPSSDGMSTAGTVAGNEPELGASEGWFSDKKGGFWAGITTAFCVVVVGGGHLALLAAYLGKTAGANTGGDWIRLAALFVIAPALLIGVLCAVPRVVRAADTRRIWGAAVIGFVGTVLALGPLCTVAWLASNGRGLLWQPVVGSSLASVSIAAFGGYFLASRRARVALVASFVLTFLVFFSFVMTLDALTTSLTPAGAGPQAAADLLGDVRQNVALIMAFYFGTDAAINVVKLLKARTGDLADLSRMDRDLAVPRPPQAG